MSNQSLRKAAQQALEALNTYVSTYDDYWERGMEILQPMGEDAISTLEDALAQPDDPTDPGRDVNVLREHVRHLERQVRQLHAEKLAQPDDKAQPVEYTTGVEWAQKPHWESEKVVKITRRAQPEHGFIYPLYATPQQAAGGGWLEAAVAWEVCASVHEKWAKGKDALYTTRHNDFVRHAEDARARHAAAPQQAAEQPVARLNGLTGASGTSHAAPKSLVEQGQGATPAGYVLVPLRMNRRMEEVVESEDWQWGDLLAAAGAVDEAEYEEANKPAEQGAELSDSAVRDGFERWMKKQRTQTLERYGDTYRNAHVRCRWEGWKAAMLDMADRAARGGTA